jgi:small subunit ribosomal protein S4
VARYRGSVCRLCRREGTKLFLKGSRCLTEKCAIDRREYPPGQHGQGRPRVSEYRIQLREKQKLKRIFGLQEAQFRGVFYKAERKQGVTGELLLQLLERRLDNVVYRLGLAASRNEARQLVTHGHFLVNGRKVDIPSYLVKIGDAIAVKERSKKLVSFERAIATMDARTIPQWLEVVKEQYRGEVKALPMPDDIALPVNAQLVVELYSR